MADTTLFFFFTPIYRPNENTARENKPNSCRRLLDNFRQKELKVARRNERKRMRVILREYNPYKGRPTKSMNKQVLVIGCSDIFALVLLNIVHATRAPVTPCHRKQKMT